MAVLISSKIKGQTREGYDGVLSAVKEVIEKAPGFIMHCAYPAEGEWVGMKYGNLKCRQTSFLQSTSHQIFLKVSIPNALTRSCIAY